MNRTDKNLLMLEILCMNRIQKKKNKKELKYLFFWINKLLNQQKYEK